MKRFVILILSIFMICSCSVAVFSEEGKYDTAAELYQAWYDDFPDYICGVWTTDGTHLIFGIQDNEAGNAAKQEILDYIRNDSTVSFVYQTYSRKQLLQMQSEIEEYFEKDLGLISIALSEQNNCLVLGIYYQMAENKDTQNMIAELTDQYGNAVSFEYTEKIVAYTTGNDTPFIQPFFLFALGTVFVLLAFCVILVVRKRNMLVLQTANGTAVTMATQLSAKEVENMVKESHYIVPTALEEKVMKSIGEKRE